MATVTFKDATRVYPGSTHPAVDKFSLEIGDGEFMVLVGPSGCGKSTSLRMLAGLEEVSDGDIYIGDRQVTNSAPKDRDIAMVFQNYALYPHMTVADNMGFALKMAGVNKDERERRVREAAELLGLTEFLDRKPKAMSGGQRQRVAMGRAIVRSPQVFCMDEPLSNLDAKLRVSTRTQIAALQQRLGVTTVYVTHDQVEAMTMGDRVCVLKDGVLQQVDTPLGLYDHPANLFVAGFIGSPAMNLLAREDDRQRRVGERARDFSRHHAGGPKGPQRRHHHRHPSGGLRGLRIPGRHACQGHLGRGAGRRRVRLRRDRRGARHGDRVWHAGGRSGGGAATLRQGLDGPRDGRPQGDPRIRLGVGRADRQARLTRPRRRPGSAWTRPLGPDSFPGSEGKKSPSRGRKRTAERAQTHGRAGADARPSRRGTSQGTDSALISGPAAG